MDLAAAKSYARGEVMVYQLDRPLPKNASQFQVEIDRPLTGKEDYYTSPIYVTTYFSKDGNSWILGPGIGDVGGIINLPELVEDGKVVSQARVAPVTSMMFDVKAQGFSGYYLQVWVESKGVQNLKPPRLLIGLA